MTTRLNTKFSHYLKALILKALIFETPRPLPSPSEAWTEGAAKFGLCCPRVVVIQYCI